MFFFIFFEKDNLPNKIALGLKQLFYYFTFQEDAAQKPLFDRFKF